ncbi:zinc metalloprotease [Nocardioides korecus]
MSRNSASRRCLAVGLLALATGLVAPAAGSTAASASTGAPHPRTAVSTACVDRATGTGAAAARGAGGHGPDTRGVSAAEQRRIEARTRTVLSQRSAERRRAAAASIGAIPVYVHVMRAKNGAGDVTARQIDRQIAVLNATYGGRDPDGAGVATGIGFYLAGTNRFDNDAWHHDRASTSYRTKTRQGGRNALNIWLVDFDYLGIATFPWDYARQPGIDGIRVQYSSLPGGGIPNYDLGKTATHETGHWLGLYHTFQGGCADPGDEVADTAAQASPSTGCPTGRDSCPAPGLDPIHNYMDYSYDSCYFTFTAGQDDRMHRMWTAYRG